MKTQVTTMGKLARDYGVHIATLKKWISKYPEIRIEKGRRTLTPKEVAAIFEKIGEP